MMLCFDKKYLGIHGIKPTDIAGFVHDAGQPTAHFNVLKSRRIDSRQPAFSACNIIWAKLKAKSYKQIVTFCFFVFWYLPAFYNFKISCERNFIHQARRHKEIIALFDFFAIVATNQLSPALCYNIYTIAII